MSPRVRQRPSSSDRISRTAIQQALDLRQQAGELAHEMRNGLAGVRGAVQIARDRMPDSSDGDVLTAALARLDRIDHQLRALLLERADEEREGSGVRRIMLPRDSKDAG